MVVSICNFEKAKELLKKHGIDIGKQLTPELVQQIHDLLRGLRALDPIVFDQGPCCSKRLVALDGRTPVLSLC